jgi:hypothetical protein
VNLIATIRMVWSIVEMLKKKIAAKAILMVVIINKPIFLGVFSPITTI